jgi:hypothetical protein
MAVTASPTNGVDQFRDARQIVEQAHHLTGGRAQRIAAEAKAKGSGDFVTDVACELPLQAVSYD